MNTLSNDNTLCVSTAGLQAGYVLIKVYANGIGVFSGRSYVDGNTSSLNVYMNDFIVQNRAKYDYLKLNDNGEVESMPLVYLYGTSGRFNYGQIRLYAVTLTDPRTTPTTINTSTTKVLVGYDYPNKDLKPNVIEDDGTNNITRVMQGCNWTADHDIDEGSFNNLLLPHYPAVQTKKYGFGLQIQDKLGNVSFGLTTPDTASANEFQLGQAQAFTALSSAQTFVSLYDLIQNQTLNEGDTPLYLKHFGTTGDEFGYYDNNVLLYYYTTEFVNSVRATYYEADSGEYLETIDYHFDDNAGVTYLQRYITAATNNLDPTSKYYNLDYWTINRIVDQGKPVYNNSSDGWQTSGESSADGLAYVNFYTKLRVESLIANTKVFIQPLFSGTTSDVRKTSFIGTCPVAILDRCYSRYYLAWNDRYGDIMSQPFDGKFVYSETLEREEVKDYKLRRRVLRNEVLPTWTLNTKWLDENVYPMYEAIYTSPYLLLYDTETDRSWNVILKDTDYKEKKYRDERKLFNLEITVENNLKENYIF